MRQPKPAFSVEYRSNRKPAQKVFDLTDQEPDYDFNQDEESAPPQLSADDEYEQALRAAEAAFENREMVPAMQRRPPSKTKTIPASATASATTATATATASVSHAAAEKIFTKPAPPAPEGRVLPDLTEKPVEDERHARKARTAHPPKVPQPDKEIPQSAPPSAAPPVAVLDSGEEPEWGFGDIIPLAPPVIDIAYPPRQALTKEAGAYQNAISAARRARWARLRPVSPRRASH